MARFVRRAALLLLVLSFAASCVGTTSHKQSAAWGGSQPAPKNDRLIAIGVVGVMVGAIAFVIAMGGLFPNGVSGERR